MDGTSEVKMQAYIENIMKESNDLRNLYPTIGNKEKFHTMVKQLLYLCKPARPDVAIPEYFRCAGVNDPTKEDENELYKRILGYLKCTTQKNLRTKVR